LSGALAQTPPLGIGQFVHQGPMLLHGDCAWRLLFQSSFRTFHALSIAFSPAHVKQRVTTNDGVLGVP